MPRYSMMGPWEALIAIYFFLRLSIKKSIFFLVLALMRKSSTYSWFFEIGSKTPRLLGRSVVPEGVVSGQQPNVKFFTYDTLRYYCTENMPGMLCIRDWLGWKFDFLLILQEMALQSLFCFDEINRNYVFTIYLYSLNRISVLFCYLWIICFISYVH
jgi:hypothetical protein